MRIIMKKIICNSSPNTSTTFENQGKFEANGIMLGVQTQYSETSSHQGNPCIQSHSQLLLYEQALFSELFNVRNYTINLCIHF
jgi:hypothetical protein